MVQEAIKLVWTTFSDGTGSKTSFVNFKDQMRKGQTNNPNGRPVGSKNLKVVQWEALHKDIAGMHAESFNMYLNNKFNDPDPNEQYRGATLYLQILEYFAPKHARVTVAGDAEAPINIIISDKI